MVEELIVLFAWILLAWVLAFVVVVLGTYFLSPLLRRFEPYAEWEERFVINRELRRCRRARKEKAS